MANEIAETPWFPTTGILLATVAMTVETIASRLGTGVESFSEDGLGEAQATATRLADGTPLSFVQYLQSPTPEHSEVLVDAAQFATRGLDAMLAPVLALIGAEPGEVTWTPPGDAEALASAAHLAERALEWRRRRAGAGNG
jgi:hypothetical protein